MAQRKRERERELERQTVGNRTRLHEVRARRVARPLLLVPLVPLPSPQRQRHDRIRDDGSTAPTRSSEQPRSTKCSRQKPICCFMNVSNIEGVAASLFALSFLPFCSPFPRQGIKVHFAATPFLLPPFTPENLFRSSCSHALVLHLDASMLPCCRAVLALTYHRIYYRVSDSLLGRTILLLCPCSL